MMTGCVPIEDLVGLLDEVRAATGGSQQRLQEALLAAWRAFSAGGEELWCDVAVIEEALQVLITAASRTDSSGLLCPPSEDDQLTADFCSAFILFILRREPPAAEAAEGGEAGEGSASPPAKKDTPSARMQQRWATLEVALAAACDRCGAQEGCEGAVQGEALERMARFCCLLIHDFASQSPLLMPDAWGRRQRLAGMLKAPLSAIVALAGPAEAPLEGSRQRPFLDQLALLLVEGDLLSALPAALCDALALCLVDVAQFYISTMMATIALELSSGCPRDGTLSCPSCIVPFGLAPLLASHCDAAHGHGSAHVGLFRCFASTFCLIREALDPSLWKAFDAAVCACVHISPSLLALARRHRPSEAKLGVQM